MFSAFSYCIWAFYFALCVWVYSLLSFLLIKIPQSFPCLTEGAESGRSVEAGSGCGRCWENVLSLSLSLWGKSSWLQPALGKLWSGLGQGQGQEPVTVTPEPSNPSMTPWLLEEVGWALNFAQGCNSTLAQNGYLQGLRATIEEAPFDQSLILKLVQLLY